MGITRRYSLSARIRSIPMHLYLYLHLPVSLCLLRRGVHRDARARESRVMRARAQRAFRLNLSCFRMTTALLLHTVRSQLYLTREICISLGIPHVWLERRSRVTLYNENRDIESRLLSTRARHFVSLTSAEYRSAREFSHTHSHTTTESHPLNMFHRSFCDHRG